MKKHIKILITIIIFIILNTTQTFAISDLSIDLDTLDLGNVGSLKWVFVVIGALLIVAILYLTYQSDKRGDAEERTRKFDLDTDAEEIIKDVEEENETLPVENEEPVIKPINENEQYNYNESLYNQPLYSDLEDDNINIFNDSSKIYDDEYEEDEEYQENIEDDFDEEDNLNEFNQEDDNRMDFEVTEIDDEVPTFSSFEYDDENEEEETIEQIEEDDENEYKTIETDDTNNFFSLMEENLIKNKEEREKKKENHDNLLIGDAFTTEIKNEEIKPKKIIKRKINKEEHDPKPTKTTKNTTTKNTVKKEEKTTKSKSKTKKENGEPKTTKRATTKKTTKKEE